MQPELQHYLEKEHIGVLSVLIDGQTPHAATIHFSHTIDPLRIIIQTSNDTVKAQPFLEGQSGKAAFVVGFSETEWITVQMRGTVRKVIDPEEVVTVRTIHYGKHPGAEKREGPWTVFLEFTPTWWRYSDLKARPAVIIEG